MSRQATKQITHILVLGPSGSYFLWSKIGVTLDIQTPR